MQLARSFLIAALALGLVVPVVLVAEVGVAEAGRKRTARASKPSGKVKVCTEKRSKKGSKRSCQWVQVFQGHNAARSSLRTEPLERPSGEIWLLSPNVRDELRVNIYQPEGGFDTASLARLDEAFRCKRTNETRAVDPRLYEQLSRIYDHFGQKRIELVSGFRFAERNSSRHYHASAMDIRIPGVSIREMYDFAESLDAGGMGIGIYPTSGFIHVDFRAPGEPSYRWTDRSGPGSGSSKAKKPTGRTTRAKKPTS